ncbi:tetratricopeptide repeat protein [Rothia sp. 11273D007AR]
MAEYSRNHSDKNRGGYKKNNDRNSSRSYRSDRSDRNESGYTRREGDRSFGDKKKPFDKNRGGGKRFDDRKNNGTGRGERSFDRKGNGPRKNFDRDQNKRGGYQGDRKDRNFNGEAKNPSGDYRPSKNAPEIDTDVTGKELENWTLRALRQLEAQNADTVAKHLVMVGRYLDIDPDFALEHAVAASKRAGRIGVVREVVGIAAYAAEDFELALRELRTHRRISGSNEHLALLVDCERALGRVEKALTLAEEAKNEEVPAAVRSEVAIVVSGIYSDQGELKKALKALEIPELNPKRGFDYSPRLFNTYAELLEQDGRSKEAARWARLALMTEAALGQGDFVEPEIFDIFTEQDLLEPEEPSVDLEAAEAQAPAAEAVEADAEADAAEATETEAADAVVAEESEASEDGALFEVDETLTTTETVVSEDQAEEEALFELSAEAAEEDRD